MTETKLFYFNLFAGLFGLGTITLIWGIALATVVLGKESSVEISAAVFIFMIGMFLLLPIINIWVKIWRATT